MCQNVCVCVCTHSVMCALEVCELRLTERECEESAAMRSLLLFTDTVLQRRLVCVCVAVTSQGKKPLSFDYE